MKTIKGKRIKSCHEVKFSPNGQYLAALGYTAILYRCPEIQELWKSPPLNHPSALAFSPDSSLLAVKNTSGYVVILSTKSGKVLADFNNHDDGEGGPLVFADDGLHVVDGTWDGSQVVRTIKGKTVFREEFGPDMVTGVWRHPSGRFWFRRFKRNEARKKSECLMGRDWPFVPGVFKEVVVPSERYYGPSFSPDGRTMAILHDWTSVELWILSFPGMKKLKHKKLPKDLDLPSGVSFSPCGEWVGVMAGNRCLLYSAQDLSLGFQKEISSGGQMDFSPDGSLVAIGGSKGEVLRMDEMVAG